MRYIMAVSSNMVRTLLAVYASSVQVLKGEIEHAQWINRIDIKSNTLSALEYRGYLTIVDYRRSGYSEAYKVTDKGIRYLERYHKRRLDELQSRYNT
jgi:DNA-binding transcriptional ArsR family regulator